MAPPAAPPGLSPQQVQQYNQLLGQWVSAMNAGNKAQAQQLYQQMMAIGQNATRNPSLLRWLQQTIQPALTFFGAGFAYARLVAVTLGELVMGAVAAIFTVEVLGFILVCLGLCLLYKWAMNRDASVRARARQAGSAPQYGMLAHLQGAHKAAFGLGTSTATT